MGVRIVDATRTVKRVGSKFELSGAERQSKRGALPASPARSILAASATEEQAREEGP
jgi:hypothetical protein